MQDKITISGRVGYDVENTEWVMYIEDRFVNLESLYKGINEALNRENLPYLRVGDELTITIERVRK